MKIVKLQIHTVIFLLSLPLIGILVFVFSIISHSPHASYAEVYQDAGNTDSCHEVQVTLSENPVCPLPPPNNPNINSYRLIIQLQSLDHKVHTVDYWDHNDFCLDGNSNGSGNCADNPINESNSIKVDAGNGTRTITISRSPVIGSQCGTYQIDFGITDIDGKAKCHYYMNAGASAGGSGRCLTGFTCKANTKFSVNGNVYIDKNNDGTKDSEYQGATVTVKQNGNAVGNDTTNGNGDYSITNINNGNYTVVLTIPAGYVLNKVTTNPQNATVSGGNINNIDFGITPLQNISGNVYMDYNNDGTNDAPYQGAAITVKQNGNVIGSDTTNGNGNYSVQNLPNGTYQVVLAVPNGDQATTPNPRTVTINNTNLNNINFGLTTQQSISGTIYNDSDGDQKYDNNDTLYTKSTSVNITGPVNVTLNNITDGTYNSNDQKPLTPGTYTVTFKGPPAGYYMTYPLNTEPPSFTVTVGKNGICNTKGFNSAQCNNGSITNLNFGITNSKPWYQSFCGDIRNDNGIIDKIPAAPSCGGISGAYAIQSTPVCSSTSPGIAFTGDTDADFGSGQAAADPYNYVAGGSNPNTSETYKPAASSIVHSSYGYLTAKLRQNGINSNSLVSYCGVGGLSNCTLSPTLPHGAYQANSPNSNVTLTGSSYTFEANQDYVILINGNLTIKEPIHVPTGSTVTFSVSGNISIDPSVGETSSASITSDLEGFYSADQSFIINGTPNVCSSGGSDKRLNIAGSVVTNAGLQVQGSSFFNNRTLCGSNAQCPTVSFTTRPDLLLNAPQLIKTTHTIWQEVAP